MGGELFFDFDTYTNMASMRHVRAFLFCSWPIPLLYVDIKITRSDGRSSNSWDHWASDILFDKDTKRIEFTMTDVNKKVTHVPCFVLSELPRKPYGVDKKDKEERFIFFIAGAATLAVLCGTFFGLVQILKMLS